MQFWFYSLSSGYLTHCLCFLVSLKYRRLRGCHLGFSPHSASLPLGTSWAACAFRHSQLRQCPLSLSSALVSPETVVCHATLLNTRPIVLNAYLRFECSLRTSDSTAPHRHWFAVPFSEAAIPGVLILAPPLD